MRGKGAGGWGGGGPSLKGYKVLCCRKENERKSVCVCVLGGGGGA